MLYSPREQQPNLPWQSFQATLGDGTVLSLWRGQVKSDSMAVGIEGNDAGRTCEIARRNPG